MKLLLVGRPDMHTTIMQPGYVQTTVQLSRAPFLPKGLPAFPEQPTTYVLYIATKQWKRVADALHDPEDVLVVEGAPAVDASQQSIAVYVTMCTTKKLQAARRQAQQQSREG